MRALMLVSATADAGLRRQVDEGQRPRPEYLALEREGVELLDWSRLTPPLTARTWFGSARHARAAMRRIPDLDVVFSDGEQVGVPLAMLMMARGGRIPHLVLGHRLTSRQKRPFFTALKCHNAMTRIVVHSSHQLDAAQKQLGIEREKLHRLPYYADGTFWQHPPVMEEKLVASAGREQRDYDTLAQACEDLNVRVFIADGSVHSPHANHRQPRRWPRNVEAGFANYVQLRDLYARAAVVVVPLIENDFQAGVTTILEAMAMGKAIVVSATAGQADVVEDGVTGLMVPPGDPRALRDAVHRLLDLPRERRRLGRNARDAFEAWFTLERYVEALLGQLCDIAAGAAPHRGPWPQQVSI